MFLINNTYFSYSTLYPNGLRIAAAAVYRQIYSTVWRLLHYTYSLSQSVCYSNCMIVMKDITWCSHDMSLDCGPVISTARLTCCLCAGAPCAGRGRCWCCGGAVGSAVAAVGGAGSGGARAYRARPNCWRALAPRCSTC